MNAVVLRVVDGNGCEAFNDSKGSVSERCIPMALTGFDIPLEPETIHILLSSFGGVGILDGGNIALESDFAADGGGFVLTGTGRLLNVRLLGRPRESPGRGTYERRRSENNAIGCTGEVVVLACVDDARLLNEA